MPIPVPTYGLLSYLDFLDPTCFTPGGTAVNDLSAQNNDWTLDSTNYNYNATNGALDVNPGNYLACNNLNILSGSNVPFTISFWFRPATGTIPSLYIFYNGGYPNNWIEFDTRDNSFVRIVANGGYIDTPPASIILNQYNNLTVTNNGTSCEIYVNNILYYSGPGTINFIQGVSNPAFDLGQRYTGTGVPGLALVAFYDYQLGTSDRNTVYNVGYDRFFGPPPPPPPPLSSPGPVGGRRFGGRFNG